MQDESQTKPPNGGDFHILRLGYYDHANLLPLLYPIDAGWAALPSPWKVELRKAPCSDLEKALERGELDAAFVPPAAVAGHGAAWVPLGGWGLCVEGRAETSLLVSPQRLDLMDGKSAAVGAEAAGSSAESLMRLLLKPYYDIALDVLLPGDPGCDGADIHLLYGDGAPGHAPGSPARGVAEDVGVAWFVLTGLPMVWLMLAAPRDLQATKPGAGDAVQILLRESLRASQEQRATILETAAGRTGLPQQRVKELFARQRYTLGDADKKGLARFLDLASRAGLVAGW